MKILTGTKSRRDPQKILLLRYVMWPGGCFGNLFNKVLCSFSMLINVFNYYHDTKSMT